MESAWSSVTPPLADWLIGGRATLELSRSTRYRIAFPDRCSRRAKHFRYCSAYMRPGQSAVDKVLTWLRRLLLEGDMSEGGVRLRRVPGHGRILESSAVRRSKCSSPTLYSPQVGETAGWAKPRGRIAWFSFNDRRGAIQYSFQRKRSSSKEDLASL